MANFNHSSPVVSSAMDTNNIVYSSTVDGSFSSVDFVKQSCNIIGPTNFKASKISYCQPLNSIIFSPLDGTDILMFDIRMDEGTNIPIDKSSTFDIHFPFLAIGGGKSAKIFDLTLHKEIYSAEISGVFGIITTINFKHDSERGLIIGTSGGQIILHNLINLSFESNEYFPVFRNPTSQPQNHVFPVNSVNVIDDAHIFVTGCNTCKVLNLKQSRELFKIDPTTRDLSQICNVGCVNYDKSLFSFGVTTNIYKNYEAVGPPSKIGFYKIEDLKEISNYGISAATFSNTDPENVISCDYEKNIHREILISELSKIPNTNYFDMLKKRKACNRFEKSTCKLDLPNELVGKIIEYLEPQHYSVISSISKQFRDCLFEKNSIVISTLFERSFFTNFLNRFKNLHTLTLKGESIRSIKSLSAKTKIGLKTLVVVAPSKFLSPTIKLDWFFKGFELENLIIYNCKKLKISSRTPTSSLKKFHLINCNLIGKFECYPSITDLDISGTNVDTSVFHNSIRKLKLCGNGYDDDFRKMVFTHLTLSVERVIPELLLPESIQYLDISGCKITKILPRLPNLVHLIMDRSDLKVDFENLGSLLHLSMKYISDPIAVAIKNKTLSSISIFGSNIETFNIDCPSLTYLNVGNTAIKDNQLGETLNKHVQLKYLHSPGCNNLVTPFKFLEATLDSLCLWNASRSLVDLSNLDFNKVPNIKIQI